jgi:hypothetical protein
VPTPEDEQFEVYLKQFRPLVPEPLPNIVRARPSRPSYARALWISGASAVLVLGVVTWQVRSNRPLVSRETKGIVTAYPLGSGPPLTVRSANAALANAHSFKDAFDDLAFRSATVALPKGAQSAVAVLSEEKTKL